jgi:DNA modification methylase
MTPTSLSYKVLQGSSIDLLKTFPEKSINAIITDPPYNISKNNNFTTMGRAGIDFGEWDKGFDLTSWIEDASRIIVPGGAIVIFNAWRNLGTISDSLEKHDFDIKDVIRWVKNNPMPRNIDRRFVVDYEYAIWAVKKGASWTFNNLSDTYERPEIKCSLTPKNEKSLGVHPTQKPVK